MHLVEQRILTVSMMNLHPIGFVTKTQNYSHGKIHQAVANEILWVICHAVIPYTTWFCNYV